MSKKDSRRKKRVRLITKINKMMKKSSKKRGKKLKKLLSKEDILLLWILEIRKNRMVFRPRPRLPSLPLAILSMIYQ